MKQYLKIFLAVAVLAATALAQSNCQYEKNLDEFFQRQRDTIRKYEALLEDLRQSIDQEDADQQQVVSNLRTLLMFVSNYESQMQSLQIYLVYYDKACSEDLLKIIEQCERSFNSVIDVIQDVLDYIPTITTPAEWAAINTKIDNASPFFMYASSLSTKVYQLVNAYTNWAAGNPMWWPSELYSFTAFVDYGISITPTFP